MPGIADQVAGSPPILGYEVWHDTDGYHARYVHMLCEHAREYGCVQELHDLDPRALQRRAVVNRIRVWVFQSRPAGDGVTRPRQADPAARS